MYPIKPKWRKPHLASGFAMHSINEFWLVTGLQIYKANLCPVSSNVESTYGILLKTLQKNCISALWTVLWLYLNCSLIFGLLNTKHKAEFKAKDSVWVEAGANHHMNRLWLHSQIWIGLPFFSLQYMSNSYFETQAQTLESGFKTGNWFPFLIWLT